jgi:hypothetical protein
MAKRVLLAGFALMACAPLSTEDSNAHAVDGGEAVETAPPTDKPLNDGLPATRLLRRAHLALTGVAPSESDYAAILAATSDEQRVTLVEAAIEKLLESPAFYRQMVTFGHDWFRVGEYISGGKNEGRWRGDQRIVMQQCQGTSKHPGALYANGADGKPGSGICDDLAAVANTIEPWWAPGSMVTVLGRAGTGVTRDAAGADCKQGTQTIYEKHLWGDSTNTCSCGPNLVYCRLGESDGSPKSATAQSRQVWDEPARFLAHLVWHDRPLSDLVLANYSVGPAALQAMYVGMARTNSKFEAFDTDDSWWRPEKRTGIADPEHDPKDALAWREFIVETRFPMLISARNYTFDPRKDPGEPAGVPAAGVLTMAGPNSSFPRERVRAARWLETFACRNFMPPPVDAKFNEYNRDPAREGTCQHCHTSIDPAAIHFKRWSFGGGNTSLVAGLGPWRMKNFKYSFDQPRARFELAFVPDTLLTPVTKAEIEANADARLIDFLPPDQALFGVASDGTIGPLGFAKILVKSGELDRCLVQKLYERIAGRALDAGTEKAYIDTLTEQFIKGNRVARAFIRAVVRSPEFRRGL